ICLGIVRFETDRVISSIEIAVPDDYVPAIYNVNTVIIPVRLTIYLNPLNEQTITLIIRLIPTTGIPERDILNGHINAFPEINVFGPVPFPDPVQLKLILDNSAVNILHGVHGSLKASAIDGTFAGNTDITLLYGEDHRLPVYVRILDIVKRIVRPQQGGSLFQVKRYVRLEV